MSERSWKRFKCERCGHIEVRYDGRPSYCVACYVPHTFGDGEPVEVVESSAVDRARLDERARIRELETALAELEGAIRGTAAARWPEIEPALSRAADVWFRELPVSDAREEATGAPDDRHGFIERVREVARQHGYAIGVHGSQQRDLDLVAVPWAVEAVGAQDLVDAICERVGLVPRDANLYADPDGPRVEPNPEPKPWGRLGWSLNGSPDPWLYVDLSVAPRAGEAVPIRRVEVVEKDPLDAAEGQGRR